MKWTLHPNKQSLHSIKLTQHIIYFTINTKLVSFPFDNEINLRKCSHCRDGQF